MDTGQLLYIIIGILWVIYTLYRKNKQMEARRMEGLSEGHKREPENHHPPVGGPKREAEEPKHRRSVFDEILEQIKEEVEHEEEEEEALPPVKGKKSGPKEFISPAPESIEYEKEPLEKVVPEGELKPALAVPPIEEYEEEEEVLVEGEPFDARKAVIYAEILRRPD